MSRPSNSHQRISYPDMMRSCTEAQTLLLPPCCLLVLQQVYDAAHRLDVPCLVTACDKFSAQVLAPNTACTLLQQAIQFMMQDYADQCLEQIRAKSVQGGRQGGDRGLH